jgi:nucleoside-diphosphate-sugar epimerase
MHDDVTPMTAESDRDPRTVLVPGGAGYIGSVLTSVLLNAGHRVRVLDSLLYDNSDSLAAVADHGRFEFARGDVRSLEETRSAMSGVTDVVLLAALVGDPVCKQHPQLATETNLTGARNVITAAAEAGVNRFVFASTCSNYGLRPDDQPAAEDDELHPLSLYAETKVEVEQELLGSQFPFAGTVLRVSTAFGSSPRMRFDLTVSEFTRELALGRELEVYDADTWRPYCHVADISAAIARVLEAPADTVSGEVFNVGGDNGNHTKRSIVNAALAALGGGRSVRWSEGGADPRNYRVSFAKIRERLGFEPQYTVEGAVEQLARVIRAGMFADVETRPLRYRNYELAVPIGEGTGGGDAG